MMPFDKAGSQHKGGGGGGGVWWSWGEAGYQWVEINDPFLFVPSGQSLKPATLRPVSCCSRPSKTLVLFRDLCAAPLGEISFERCLT